MQRENIFGSVHEFLLLLLLFFVVVVFCCCFFLGGGRQGEGGFTTIVFQSYGLKTALPRRLCNVILSNIRLFSSVMFSEISVVF